MFDVALMYRSAPRTNNGNNHPNPPSPPFPFLPPDLPGLSCFPYDPDCDGDEDDDKSSDASGRLCLVDSSIPFSLSESARSLTSEPLGRR